jgi:hypothetical protein
MSLVAALLLLAQDRAAEEAFKKIEERIERAPALSVKIEGTLTPPGEKGALGFSGSLLLKGPSKVLFTIALKQGDQKREAAFLTDGVTVRRRMTGQEEERFETPIKNARARFGAVLSRSGLGLGSLLGRLPAGDAETPSTIELADLKTGEDDKDSKTLSFTFKVPGLETAAAAGKLWYDPKTHRIIKRTVRLVTTEGETRSTESYSDWSFDADIPDEKFVLPEKK